MRIGRYVFLASAQLLTCGAFLSASSAAIHLTERPRRPEANSDLHRRTADGLGPNASLRLFPCWRAT